MELKLGYYSDIKNRDLLDVVNDGKSHTIKFTTNKLEIEFDRKDERYIKSINNVKMVFKMREGGCLILIGNLGCDFRQPVGGMFFCKRSYIDQNADYDNITGVETDVVFSNHPETIDRMQKKLEDLKNMPNFVFNLSQFDEFMEIFTFYKQLSSELNNNTTYKIKSVSDKYYYVKLILFYMFQLMLKILKLMKQIK